MLMIDDTLLAVGMGIVGAILAIGISLSAWKGEFEKDHNQCSGNCCNTDHWNKEDKEKLTPEQYYTMKDNIELFKRTQRI